MARRFLMIGARAELMAAAAQLAASAQGPSSTLRREEPPSLAGLTRPGKIDIMIELPPERKKSVRERFGRPPRNLGKGGRQYKNMGRFLK